MAAGCRAPDRLMRVNACGEDAGKMAESGEELAMARQATAALREETSSPLARHSPEGTAPSHALNPMDAWMAAARMVPLLGLTAAPDDDPSLRLAEVLDRSLHYAMSRLTQGLSQMGLAETYLDWLTHLTLSPGKQVQLWQKGSVKARACPATWCAA